MKELKNDFKTKQFKPVYLIYGDEPYLIRYYTNLFMERLIDDTMMNSDVFEGKDFESDTVVDAAETLPFLSEQRLVFIKDSGLLTTGRKNDTEALAKYIPSIPATTTMVFVENNIDKRNKLYKQIASTGRAVEINTPTENELVKWIANIFKKKNKEIHPQTIRILLNTIPKGMDAAYAEADKLGDFVGERATITPEDIQAVCTKSLETRIFDLVKALCNGQLESALTKYHTMLVAKEQPLMILTMIARQFRLILQCKVCAEKRMMHSEIAATLNLRDFIVRECLQQARHFTIEKLKQALFDCQDTDLRIKTGLIGGEMGVELLIVEYGL